MAEKNYEASLDSPVELTIENKTGITQTFRYFLCNFTETLAPNDSVKLLVTSSERLAYYTKIKELLAGENATAEIVITFPDPLDVGVFLPEGVMDPMMMLDLISRSKAGEEISLTLKQGEVSYKALVKAVDEADNECQLVVDENNVMSYGAETNTETGNSDSIIYYVNGFDDFNKQTPH